MYKVRVNIECLYKFLYLDLMCGLCSRVECFHASEENVWHPESGGRWFWELVIYDSLLEFGVREWLSQSCSRPTRALPIVLQ